MNPEQHLILILITCRYHISINRIGNIGQLTVLPANLPPGEEADTTPVSGASPAGFSKMDLLPTDTLWIGEGDTGVFGIFVGIFVCFKGDKMGLIF